VDAHLNNLFSRLLSLDFGGSITRSTSEYKGVLQADLPAALQNVMECRKHVFDKLIDRILPSSNSQRPTDPHYFTLLENRSIPLLGTIFVLDAIKGNQIVLGGKSPDGLTIPYSYMARQQQTSFLGNDGVYYVLFLTGIAGSSATFCVIAEGKEESCHEK
jgi:hypothetical protein